MRAFVCPLRIGSAWMCAVPASAHHMESSTDVLPCAVAPGDRDDVAVRRDLDGLQLLDVLGVQLDDLQEAQRARMAIGPEGIETLQNHRFSPNPALCG
jgi:hypothetical protein